MALTLLLLAATTHAFSPAKSRVVVVGSSNQDLIASGARIPRPGETVLHEDFMTSFGGKGANQCVQAIGGVWRDGFLGARTPRLALRCTRCVASRMTGSSRRAGDSLY